MLISIQKYKLQYAKISPILSTQITAPVKKNISISQYKNISSRTNIFIGCATIFFSTRGHSEESSEKFYGLLN